VSALEATLRARLRFADFGVEIVERPAGCIESTSNRCTTSPFSTCGTLGAERRKSGDRRSAWRLARGVEAWGEAAAHAYPRNA
jgi:hypothetical protein